MASNNDQSKSSAAGPDTCNIVAVSTRNIGLAPPQSGVVMVKELADWELQEMDGVGFPNFEQVMEGGIKNYSVSDLPHEYKMYTVLSFEQYIINVDGGKRVTKCLCRHHNTLELFYLSAPTQLREILEAGVYRFPFHIAIQPDQKCQGGGKKYHSIKAMHCNQLLLDTYTWAKVSRAQDADREPFLPEEVSIVLPKSCKKRKVYAAFSQGTQ